MDKTLNTTPPIISVLMPVYNGEKYLREAVDSILNQTYKNFEFIIINDGSTDSTEKIILAFNDTRIRYLKNDTNLGLITTLNKGIESAKGIYIARMDADDISLPNRLKHQFEFMELNPELGVCACSYVQFSGSTKKHYSAFYSHDEALGFMLFNSSIIHPSLLIRKSVLDLFSPIFDSNYKHAEDYELWSKLIFKCKFSAVNTTEFYYRIHKLQVTQKHQSEQIISANKVRKNILDKAGFIYSENELRVHYLIGSSQRIKSIQDIQLAEIWLKNLLEQNKKLRLINETVFSKIIGKQWADSCGNTSIGLKAFSLYNKSSLKKLYKSNNFKLLAKCIIRKFKK